MRREIAGLSQAEIAHRIGTSQSAIAAYENGKRVPTKSTIQRILMAIGVCPSQILQVLWDDVIDVVNEFGGDDSWIFGSIARHQDNVNSDIDLAVRFRPKTGLFAVAGMKQALEDLLGTNVDLLDVDALRPGRDDEIMTELTGTI